MQCLSCNKPVHEPDDVICEDCIEYEHYEEIYEPQKAYYMGDLCYVVPDPDWAALVNIIWKDIKNPNYGKLDYKGESVYVFNTVHGDGIYTASYGGDMSHVMMVDSGTIAVVPLSLINGVTAADTTVIYLTDAEFENIRIEDGIIYVGGYNINTN